MLCRFDLSSPFSFDRSRSGSRHTSARDRRQTKTTRWRQPHEPPTSLMVGPAGLEPATSSTPSNRGRSAGSPDFLTCLICPDSGGVLYGVRRLILPVRTALMAVMRSGVPPVSHRGGWGSDWLTGHFILRHFIRKCARTRMVVETSWSAPSNHWIRSTPSCHENPAW